MSWIKNILLISFITLALLVLLEICARVYIYFDYGTSIAGLQERTVNLNYQPFTMWGKNLDEQAKDFLKERSQDEFRILLIGGSVAAGFDSKIIEKAFSEKLKNKIVVFNAASGGFNIRQEAISLALVSEKIRPHLVLVLDGANDIQHALRSDIIVGTTYVDHTYRTILESPYLGPVVFVLQNSQLYNGLLRLSNRKTFDMQKVAVKLGVAKDIYLETREFINKYAKGARIPIVFMLQPHVGFSNSHEDRLAKERFSYREAVVVSTFKDIAGLKRDNLCFVDANQRVAAENLSLGFSDDVHFRDASGYEFIAKLFTEQYERCYGSTGRISN